MISRRVRWLAIVLPAVVVGIIELLSDTVLDPFLPFPWDTILVMLVVAVLAAGFARWTFGRMDRLTTSLEARNVEVETRAASANALHAVSQAIASLADLEEILEATVSSARTLLGADLGLLVLIGPDGEPVLRSTSGPDDAFDRSGSGGGDEASRFLRIPHPPTMLAAPLRRGGTTIGTLAVAGRSMPSHQVGDVETLSSLANHAAIAIENHRLEAELRRLAVQHERERIAREIHDGLAQLLGYVNTKSQAVEGLLEAGRLDEAMVQMAELSAAARSNYVDVREAIQGLAEPAGGEVDLGAEVRHYADRFAEASKLAVSVHLEPGLEAAGVTPAVRDEVFGTIREALDQRPQARGGPARHGRDRRARGTPRRHGRRRRTRLRSGPRGGRTRRLAALRHDGDAPPGGRHRRPDHLDERARRRHDRGAGRAPRRGRRGGGRGRAMRILIADDHALFRDGVASLVGAWGHDVVGLAGSEDEAVALSAAVEPDLVLMDVRMPGGSGLAATSRIKAAQPAIAIVILTVSEDEDDLFEAIKAGAQGYLLKNLEAAELRSMLEGVGRGEAAISAGDGHPDHRGVRPPGARVGGCRGRTPAGRTGSADGARARRPRARDPRPAQQGDRGRARDQREHREVPPPQHPREAPRRQSRGARGAGRARGSRPRPGRPPGLEARSRTCQTRLVGGHLARVPYPV